MKRLCAGILPLVFVLFLGSAAFAVVHDDRIADLPGLRFENVIYNWDRVFIDVVNMTNRNVLFGGTMIFLDRFGNPVASAHLLPKKVPRNGAKRYTGYFIEGAGEMARRAERVVWDFGAR